MSLFSFFRSILPASANAQIDVALGALRVVLQDEPLRAIGYGAIAVVFLATRGAELSGHPLAVGTPTLDAITIAVAGAITAVVEFARKYVSPVGATTSTPVK